MFHMHLRSKVQTLTHRRNFAASFSLAVVLALLSTGLQSRAGTVLQPWVPIFKGVDYAVGTNTPGGGGFAQLQVAYCVRVDLTESSIRLFASPRHTNWLANSTETYGYTMTNFLKVYGLQVAVNAGQFSPASYFQAEGIACDASGMVFSEGKMVSPPVIAGLNDAATFCFTSNNVPTYYPTNVPPAPTNGVYTAVSGYYNILYNGVNVGSNYIGNPDFVHSLQPRTLMGLSQDRHYLFLLVIDGRQGSIDYSEGAYDWQAAEWLKLAGAWDGAYTDGGGSSCMVVMDTTGMPVPLNHDSSSLTSPGFRERTVGSHFGIYADPLPGFFNNVKVIPDDTFATVTWTTISPTTTQLKYGPTTNMTILSSSNSVAVTNHSVFLTNLTPGTGYYFNALGSIGSTQYVSSNYYFLTTNYVKTAELAAFADEWKYTTANMDGSNWKTRGYVDSSWEGAGAGLLWANINGPNGQIPVPLNTQMPENPITTFPYLTYYFRKHFNYTNQVSGAQLQFVGYVDDGAVFYLNGTEIYRLRMPAAPTVISNGTVATATPCSGDATCSDSFSLSGPVITTNLLVGDNVFAVEVHNRSSGSPDVTFGLAATATSPFIMQPLLSLAYSNNVVTLSWNRSGFVLQQADAAVGPWGNVPGPVTNSPFTTNNSGTTRFFRLAK